MSLSRATVRCSSWRTASRDEPRSFLDHLADLRRCALRCLAVWLAATLLVAPAAPWLLRALLHPLLLTGRDPEALIRGQRLGAGFSLLFQMMMWGGLALSLPLLLYFVAQFVFPGLRTGEKRMVRMILLASGLLFIGGVLLSYRALPVVIEAFFSVNTWMGITIWPLHLDDYVKLIARTLLGFGLAFQLPLILLTLGWWGLLPAALLRSKRRHAIVGIFVLAMILTPPDAVSMVAMALPMCALYEICILLIAARDGWRSPKASAAR